MRKKIYSLLLNDRHLIVVTISLLLIFGLLLYILLFCIKIGPENEILWNLIYQEYTRHS